MNIVVKTYEGLESVLEKEIRQLGVTELTVGKRAIYFEGDKELLYKANLHLRTAVKVLVNIHHFKARNEEELYRNAREFDWFSYFRLNQSFALETNVKSDYFRHSKYVAYKVKDAIVDKFTDKKGRRPNVNIDKPDYKFNIRIFNDEVDISLDSSGDSLHHRGYKIETLNAPLSEVLASGILLNTDFENHDSLYDPMCGSGTLLTEALMIETNTAPNLFRDRFGFMSWNDFEGSLWDKCKTQARVVIKPPRISIRGTDNERKALFATKKNLLTLPYGETVKVDSADFFKPKKETENKFLIFNPPYDVRIENEDIIQFYTEIGNILKRNYAPATAWIFSANLEALKYIGLKPSQKIKLMNGKLPAELRKFEIY